MKPREAKRLKTDASELFSRLAQAARAVADALAAAWQKLRDAVFTACRAIRRALRRCEFSWDRQCWKRARYVVTVTWVVEGEPLVSTGPSLLCEDGLVELQELMAEDGGLRVEAVAL